MTSFVETKVTGVYTVMTRRGPAPIVVLRDERDRFLPIFVGYAEAISIRVMLEGIETELPFYYDLLLSLLKEFGGIIEKVSIALTPDDRFSMALSIRVCEERPKEFAGRPGDGIAIALRSGVPLLVSEEAMSKYGVSRRELEEAVGKIEEE